MLGTVKFEKNNFAFMIPNPSLDCSCVVLNFWPNLSLVVLIKLFFKKKAYNEDQIVNCWRGGK